VLSLTCSAARGARRSCVDRSGRWGRRRKMGCGVSRALPPYADEPIEPQTARPQREASTEKRDGSRRVEAHMLHYFRANALSERGCAAAAIEEYSSALQSNPQFATGAL
jgi:hypothetical protein